MGNFENPSAIIKVLNLAFSMLLSLININNFSNPPSRRGCFHSFCCYFLLMYPLFNQFDKYYVLRTYQCCNEASKIFVLRRFLAEDPSSSSSSVHFKLSKNLRSFEDFRPKIPKIFGIKSLFVEEVLKEN